MSTRRRPMRARRWVVALATAALAATTVTTGAAEDDPLSPPPLERYARWGPLRARPGLAIRDLGYDSNILSAADPVGDYLVRVAPRVDLLVLFGKRAFLEIDEEVQYTAYARNGDLSYWDQFGTARLTVPFGRVGAYVETQYDRVRQSPIDLDDVRPVFELWRWELGGVARVGGRTTVELGRSVGDRRHFDDDLGQVPIPISAQLDRTETYDHVRARYRAFGRTTVTLDASFGDVAFDVPNLVGAPGFERDARERRLLPGLRLGSGGPLSGSVRAGWSEIDYRGARIRDFSGAVGDLEIVYRPTGRISLAASGERDAGFSVASGNNYYVYRTLEIEGAYYLRRFLGLEIGGDVGTLTVPGTGRRDDLDRVFGGVRLRVAPGGAGGRVEYRVRIGRSRRRSNVEILDRDRSFVRVSVVYGF